MSLANTDYPVMISRAWQPGDLELQELISYASQLQANQAGPLAAVLYQTWLQRQQTAYNHLAYFNLGVILFNESDLPAAKQAYQQAINLSVNFVQARYNLGLVYERMGDIESAIAEWRWIDDHTKPDQADNKPILTMALNRLGSSFENLKHYGNALAYLSKSLAIEPLQEDVIHHWVFLREKQCLWPVYASMPGLSLAFMQQSTSALGMLSLSDDPQAQLAAAQSFVAKKIPSNLPSLAPSQSYQHDKIRVAYCSSDFCLHPVAMLTVELFELHNRDQFEVYGYCWTKQGHSPLRQRVIDAMDHFHCIGDLSDEAAAQLIRSHEIDILIDLHGQTLGARPTMLAYRPAAIQITYLGLPATTGLPSIDYVIADRFLIPEQYAEFYSEKPLYMPDVYQVCDRQRQHAEIPSRASCGLPENAVVFCSFNNNYKYTAEVFGTWMKILRQVPDSVLWLLADNPWAELNLKQTAMDHGVAAERLIFAPRVLPEQYLARFAIADLFLDTFPFNAGTTANDALWMGLPVLTLTGRSFASRMAGALLTAADLPELIHYDLASYQAKAVELALSPTRCQALRQHLVDTRQHGVLFDTQRFVHNLESAFKRLLNT